MKDSPFKVTIISFHSVEVLLIPSNIISKIPFRQSPFYVLRIFSSEFKFSQPVTQASDCLQLVIIIQVQIYGIT